MFWRINCFHIWTCIWIRQVGSFDLGLTEGWWKKCKRDAIMFVYVLNANHLNLSIFFLVERWRLYTIVLQGYGWLARLHRPVCQCDPLSLVNLRRVAHEKRMSLTSWSVVPSALPASLAIFKWPKHGPRLWSERNLVNSIVFDLIACGIIICNAFQVAEKFYLRAVLMIVQFVIVTHFCLPYVAKYQYMYNGKLLIMMQSRLSSATHSIVYYGHSE